MTEKYKDKYRIKSARLEGYDYSREGLYFITICTKNREDYFGEIKNSKMILSNLGTIADIFWHEIKNHTKNTILHEFIVMPNHIHGIIEIVDHHGCSKDDACIVSTVMVSPLQNISPKSGTISRIVGSYKSAVSKHAHRLKYEFSWQPRYWDHIIRNEKEYYRISDYIKKNPNKWHDDKLNEGKGNTVLENTSEYNKEEWMI